MSEAISGEVAVTPSDYVNALDRLVGCWNVSGGPTARPACTRSHDATA